MDESATKRGMIYITQADFQRLQKLIAAVQFADNEPNREYLDMLADELDRAEIVPPEHIPSDVITMRSRVRLLDLDSGKSVVYSLVFPYEADVGKGKVSVLAPIGTAMLGYRVGEVITWKVPAGVRRFKVEEILYQPEAAGDYHL